MHMSDSLLSPAVGAAFWAGSLGAIVYASKKIKAHMDEKIIPLMGVLGAFIFAAQMVNFTIPGTGSSGHIGGGMILAILLGPAASFLVIASVLTTQALFFADGGILALGCNIWNLGFYPCFIAYPLIYRPVARNDQNPKKVMAASVISVVIGLQLGALSVVLQTLVSDKSELPFWAFTYMMLPAHLAIGLAEGFITAGVVNYVRSNRPEILESVYVSKPIATGVSIKRIGISFLVLAAIIGGALSWVASAKPDGLEWSIERISGKPELPDSEVGIASSLKKLQDKTALLPGYNFKAIDKTITGKRVVKGDALPEVDSGTSLSGILGSVMVLIIVLLIGIGLKTVTRNKSR